jgi:hypothetical protein
MEVPAPAAAGGAVPAASVTPRGLLGCDGAGTGAGGLSPLSPPGLLDPLALLRMSMVNPELPSPSPNGADGKIAVSPMFGAAAPLGGCGPSAGAGMLSPLSAGEGGGEWQRRRRVSAVLREELAEVAKALEEGLPQV